MNSFNNGLLRLMSGDAIAALGDTAIVALAMRQRLDGPDAREHVYFIESGVASVIADVDARMAVELGIIGPEGMVGLNLVYGDIEDPYHTVMQVGGSAVQVEAARLRELIEVDDEARRLLLRFARAFSIQVASTALANGRSRLDERLARWLLMVSDRVGPSFAITHEFISVMLGVRRSGVTLAVQILEGKGFIRATRGSITILDRNGLKAAANGAYGFAEQHYERLLGAVA